MAEVAQTDALALCRRELDIMSVRNECLRRLDCSKSFTIIHYCLETSMECYHDPYAGAFPILLCLSLEHS
jgi:hypothetical protein